MAHDPKQIEQLART